MIKKRFKFAITIIFIAISIYFLRYSSQNKQEEDIDAVEVMANFDNVDLEIGSVGDNIAISRALLAKMISLTYFSSDEIEAMEYSINYSDLDKKDWYAKYINAFSSLGLFEDSKQFKPNASLSLKEAQDLINKMDKDNKVKLELDETNEDMAISYALWTEMYLKTIKNLSAGSTLSEKFQIKESQIQILSTTTVDKNLEAWTSQTNIGKLKFHGYALDSYIDKKIQVLIKNDEILAIIALDAFDPSFERAYITDLKEDSVEFFYSGIKKEYKLAIDRPSFVSNLADLIIKDGKVSEIKFIGKMTRGRIKRSTSTEVEFENNVKIPYAENVKVYKDLNGKVESMGVNNIPVGTDASRYYLEDGKIVGIVQLGEIQATYLRICLNTSNFTGLIHKNISLSSENGFDLKIGEEIRSFEKGKVLNINENENADLFAQMRIYLVPKDNGMITISSISRNWGKAGSPKYRGTIEIAKENNGYSIVNELSLERYLYSVLPSEMPSSHGLEAAKAQAVTARSYAYQQYYANKFRNFGAHMDDSTNSQVYNNLPTNEIAMQAVNETAGQCLTYNGDVVSTNFFSTSSGMTANSGDVWAAGAVFPSQGPSYLKTKKQYKGSDYGDLSEEKNAEKFFKANDIDSYDKEYPWFRWTVEMSKNQVQSSINSKIKAMYMKNPRLVKVLQENGDYKSDYIDGIGELINLEVGERAEGGNLLSVIIKGSQKTVKVFTEYNIRTLIVPSDFTDEKSVVINRHDGSQISNNKLMPSAFYVFDKIYDDNKVLSSIKFFGGGNGHGVGMSQNGAKAMIDEGKTFKEVLEHYYGGTKLEKVLIYQ